MFRVSSLNDVLSLFQQYQIVLAKWMLKYITWLWTGITSKLRILVGKTLAEMLSFPSLRQSVVQHTVESDCCPIL